MDPPSPHCGSACLSPSSKEQLRGSSDGGQAGFPIGTSFPLSHLPFSPLFHSLPSSFQTPVTPHYGLGRDRPQVYLRMGVTPPVIPAFLPLFHRYPFPPAALCACSQGESQCHQYGPSSPDTAPSPSPAPGEALGAPVRSSAECGRAASAVPGQGQPRQAPARTRPRRDSTGGPGLGTLHLPPPQTPLPEEAPKTRSLSPKFVGSSTILLKRDPSPSVRTTCSLLELGIPKNPLRTEGHLKSTFYLEIILKGRRCQPTQL